MMRKLLEAAGEGICNVAFISMENLGVETYRNAFKSMCLESQKPHDEGEIIGKGYFGKNSYMQRKNPEA